MYHQSYFNRFICNYEEKSSSKTEMTDEEIFALSAEKEFKILIKRKILIQKNWYLLAGPMERNGEPIRDLLCRKKVR